MIFMAQVLSSFFKVGLLSERFFKCDGGSWNRAAGLPVWFEAKHLNSQSWLTLQQYYCINLLLIGHIDYLSDYLFIWTFWAVDLSTTPSHPVPPEPGSAGLSPTFMEEIFRYYFKICTVTFIYRHSLSNFVLTLFKKTLKALVKVGFPLWIIWKSQCEYLSVSRRGSSPCSQTRKRGQSEGDRRVMAAYFVLSVIKKSVNHGQHTTGFCTVKMKPKVGRICLSKFAPPTSTTSGGKKSNLITHSYENDVFAVLINEDIYEEN